jgi:hypothetical protein
MTFVFCFDERERWVLEASEDQGDSYLVTELVRSSVDADDKIAAALPVATGEVPLLRHV